MMLTDAICIFGVVGFLVCRFVGQPRLRTSLASVEKQEDTTAIAIAVAKLAVVRFLSTFCTMVAIGAATGRCMIWWVESWEVAGVSDATIAERIEMVEIGLDVLNQIQAYLPPISMTLALIPAMLLFGWLLYQAVQTGFGVEKRIRRHRARLRTAVLNSKVETLKADLRMSDVQTIVAQAHGRGESTEVCNRLYQILLDLDVMRRLDDSGLDQHAVAETEATIAKAREAGSPTATIATLYEALIQNDVARHIRGALQRHVGARSEGGCLKRAAALLFGPRVSSAAKRLGTAVTMTATLLLIPASLLLTTNEIAGTADQIVENLENTRRHLSLALSDQAASRALALQRDDSTPEPSPRPTPMPIQNWCVGHESLSSEDCATAAEFGRLYEVAWAGYVLSQTKVDVSNLTKRRWAERRREWTRREVLARASGDRGASLLRVVVAAKNGERGWLWTLEDADLRGETERRPATPLGKQAEIAAQAYLLTHPGSIAIAKDEPIGPHARVSGAVNGLVALLADLARLADGAGLPLDEAMTGALKEGFGAWAETLIASDSRASNDASYLDRAGEVGIKRVLAASTQSGRIDNAALKALEGFVDAHTLQRYRDAFAEVIALSAERDMLPDSIGLEVVEPRSPTAQQVADQLTHLPQTSGKIPALASYRSLFPGVPGQDVHSLPARVQRRLHGVSAVDSLYGSISGTSQRDSVDQRGRPVSRLVHTPIENTLKRAHDARTWKALNVSPHVGGVLIGRMPSEAVDAPDPDLIGFDYAIDDAKGDLTLHFWHRDARRITLGPYQAATAHLALAYAADGRPTTVSLLPSTPLMANKVHLHPALVNTAVGCAATVIDLFVDSLLPTGSSLRDERDRLAAESHRVVDLYSYAWAKRASQARFSKFGASCGIGKRRSFRQVVSWSSTLAALRHKLQQPLATSVDTQTALRPLYERPTLYDRKLVDIVRLCWDPSSHESSLNCLDHHAVTLVQSVSAGGSVPCSWFVVPVRIRTISGVREEPYALDADLRFAQTPGPLDSGPLKFIVHNSVDVSDSTSIDDASWEYSSIQNEVQAVVLDEATKSDQAKSVLLQVYEFTVLQRLFRTAFLGRLGNDFPVERLASMATDTRSFVARNPEYSTLRWLEAEEFYILLQQVLLMEALDGWQERHSACAEKVFQQCLDAVATHGRRALTHQRCALLEEVPRSCLTDRLGTDMLQRGGEALATYQQAYDAILGFRALMGVVEDGAGWPRGLSCTQETTPRPK